MCFLTFTLPPSLVRYPSFEPNWKKKKKAKGFINPFIPTSDQDRISPYNINTISSRQVMRIEKNINHGIIG